MEPRQVLEILTIAEKLKDTTRHCYTSKGRKESVAEHSWMMALMAFLLKEEFSHLDMTKVLTMCLIHDLGEAFTGDIPTFEKTQTHRDKEEKLLFTWVSSLPQPYADQMIALYKEMAALETEEAKLYKALDGMEAVIQHNFSDISTWEPHEYDLNLTHASDKVAFSPYLTRLRQEMRQDTLDKIASSQEG